MKIHPIKMLLRFAPTLILLVVCVESLNAKASSSFDYAAEIFDESGPISPNLLSGDWRAIRLITAYEAEINSPIEGVLNSDNSPWYTLRFTGADRASVLNEKYRGCNNQGDPESNLGYQVNNLSNEIGFMADWDFLPSAYSNSCGRLSYIAYAPAVYECRKTQNSNPEIICARHAEKAPSYNYWYIWYQKINL